MFKKKITIKSANFKRDYMTFLAIALLGLMIVGEFVVAIGVPLFVSRVDMYAKMTKRHETLQLFLGLLRISVILVRGRQR